MSRTYPALAALALLTAPLEAQVGLASSAHTVMLTATKMGTVGIALANGSVATLAGNLGLGVNSFAPLSVETTWDLDPTLTSAVLVVAFFRVPAAALVAAGAAIPASAVWGRVPTGSHTSFAPFTGAAPGGEMQAGVPGGTLVLFSQPISGTSAAGARTDRLEVRLDLTGRPDLPAGHYQGTLNLLAITQ